MSAIDDAKLLKMAEAELLGEAKRAAARHSTLGITGWRSGPKANKLFLANTILQNMASNRVLSRKLERKCQNSTKKKKRERKLLNSKGGQVSNYIFKKPDSNKSKSIGTHNIKTCNHKRKSIENFKKDSEKFDSKKNEKVKKDTTTRFKEIT